eukprot:4018838-Alexandrium_andersonii.AAC.1
MNSQGARALQQGQRSQGPLQQAHHSPKAQTEGLGASAGRRVARPKTRASPMPCLVLGKSR